jgi:3-oxoacyl-[acyl-carrier protein] reductase
MGCRVSRPTCALVVGGARGVGPAIVAALARDGWPVAVQQGDDHAAADRVAARVEREEGGRVVAARGSAGDAAALAELEEQLGPVGALVYVDDGSAAIGPMLAAARCALQSMGARGFGRIVNVAQPIDLAAVGRLVAPDARPNGREAALAASRGALTAATRALALEAADRSVTVNAVAPGVVEGDLDGDRQLKLMFPARRTGTAYEVAACVRFLASPESSYVTGATLPVDGGLTA